MRRTLTLLIAALALLACHRKPSTPPDVIVRVGERMVTLADFKRYIEHNAGTDLAQVTPEVASAMLDQYVEEILLGVEKLVAGGAVGVALAGEADVAHGMLHVLARQPSDAHPVTQ